jgi:hypothetical protein
MARSEQVEIRMCIIIRSPVPGVMHSLQDRAGNPVDPRRSMRGEPLSFELPIRVGPGPKFYGDQVRNGGGDRRFVYIGIGKQAGDAASCWDRRMKVDIHSIPVSVLHTAATLGGIEGTIGGTGTDGSPACATVPVGEWRASGGGAPTRDMKNRRTG